MNEITRPLRGTPAFFKELAMLKITMEQPSYKAVIEKLIEFYKRSESNGSV